MRMNPKIRVWLLRALVVLALWTIVVVTVGGFNAWLSPQMFKWGEYALISIGSTAVLIVLTAAAFGALELIRRIK